MSVIGEVKVFKVEKIINIGAFLSSEGDRRNYFIHFSEIDKSDKKNEIIEGNTIKGRVIGTRELKNGRISYQVSTKELGNDDFKQELLNDKIEEFLQESERKYKMLTRHKERRRSENNRRRRR